MGVQKGGNKGPGFKKSCLVGLFRVSGDLWDPLAPIFRSLPSFLDKKPQKYFPPFLKIAVNAPKNPSLYHFQVMLGGALPGTSTAFSFPRSTWWGARPTTLSLRVASTRALRPLTIHSTSRMILKEVTSSRPRNRKIRYATLGRRNCNLLR